MSRHCLYVLLLLRVAVVFFAVNILSTGDINGYNYDLSNDNRRL